MAASPGPGGQGLGAATSTVGAVGSHNGKARLALLVAGGCF